MPPWVDSMTVSGSDNYEVKKLIEKSNFFETVFTFLGKKRRNWLKRSFSNLLHLFMATLERHSGFFMARVEGRDPDWLGKINCPSMMGRSDGLAVSWVQFLAFSWEQTREKISWTHFLESQRLKVSKLCLYHGTITSLPMPVVAADRTS